MSLILVHVLLLFIQFIDCQQKRDLFRCRCITVLHEIFKVPNIPSDECQLFTDSCSDFLSAALFGFCKCKIIFSCHSAVHAGSGKSICFAEANEDRFQFFPCFIQQGKILWLSDIRWSAGGIKHQGSFIFRGLFLLCILPVTSS